MAQAGGIGVIHRNLDVDGQAAQVRQVKKFESGMVVNPITIGPDATLADALALMKRSRHLRHPGGRPARQGRPASWSASSPTATCASPTDPRQKVSELMTHDNLVTVREGVSQDEAKRPAAPAPHREAAGGRRRTIAASA